MTDQNNAVLAPQGKIRIYSVGGAGIGVGKYFEQERGVRNEGYAELHPAYADTSTASTFGVPEDSFYQIPNADGSGGVRSHNAAEIVRSTNDILARFEPLEMNIVIGSVTGGSGSVWGPSIVSELLARDLPVIVFAISGDETKQYIENSIKTLLSYEGITSVRKKPVVMAFHQNHTDGTVEEIDQRIQLAISCLTVLYSRRNKNLDTRDLYNWLNFNHPGVTTFAEQVAILSVHQGQIDLPDQTLISVATLNTDLNNTRIGQPVDYQRVGVPMVIDEASRLKFPLHFAISDGLLDGIVKRLRRQVAEYDSKALARTIRNRLGTGKEEVTSNGLVF